MQFRKPLKDTIYLGIDGRVKSIQKDIINCMNMSLEGKQVNGLCLKQTKLSGISFENLSEHEIIINEWKSEFLQFPKQFEQCFIFYGFSSSSKAN